LEALVQHSKHKLHHCHACRDSGLVTLGDGTKTLCPDCHGWHGDGDAFCTNPACDEARGHDVPVIPARLYGDYPCPSEPAYDSCPVCRDDLTWYPEELPRSHPWHFLRTELGERYVRRYITRSAA
jgi:hypothetical protein